MPSRGVSVLLPGLPREFQFCYLAFHGNRGHAVLLDDEKLTLTELGRLLRKHRAATNNIIHIASCYGLQVAPAALKACCAGIRPRN